MFQKRSCRILIVLILAGVLIQGCTPDRPLPKEGHWEGSPSVSFEVTASGEVVNFTIDVEACIINVQGPLTISADSQLEMGTVNAEGLPEEDDIVGTFTSLTSISGTYANPIVCILSDGSTRMTSSYSVEDGATTLTLNQWDASWQEP